MKKQLICERCLGSGWVCAACGRPSMVIGGVWKCVHGHAPSVEVCGCKAVKVAAKKEKKNATG